VGEAPAPILPNLRYQHGRRQMCSMDTLGFPRTKPKGAKSVKGFQTGDMVRAVVSSGIKVGTYVGCVAVRTTGSFNITTKQGTIQGINHRFCTALHKCDGYDYGQGQNPIHPKKGRPVSSPCMNAGGLEQVESDEETDHTGS
jgi:hypothetical protein